jgi:DMSO/TMAO reductase YedYZ molybdopterin-dependent catalytic subunit
MKQTHKGLRELYASDPLEADRLLFGRQSDPLTRRGFLSGMGTMTAILGAEVVFSRFMPAGMIPAALAEEETAFSIPGKHPGLIVLNDRPVNAETPAYLLDDPVTPADRLFVRNNGIPPVDIDLDNWTLEIDGESVEKPVSFSLAELKHNFKHYTYQLTLECGGNGRSEFDPPARGNQWTTGAVGCPRWTGVRLADVLKAVGVKDHAVYIGYYGADTHISGNPDKRPISRGVPIGKAMEDETLIAWQLNGQDLPLMNGYPLRLVVGGWPASTSGKWLRRISVRNKVHDGPKMGGYSYRVPCKPVVPGAEVAEEDMCIIESMPVKSLVTYPRSGVLHQKAEPLTVRGHAWAGDLAVATVDVSIDFGQTWRAARLEKPANRLAWQRFEAQLKFPQTGYYEVWARATDDSGRSQPMVVPGWNPKGYLNNACHRVAVKVV